MDLPERTATGTWIHNVARPWNVEVVTSRHHICVHTGSSRRLAPLVMPSRQQIILPANIRPSVQSPPRRNSGGYIEHIVTLLSWCRSVEKERYFQVEAKVTKEVLFEFVYFAHLPSSRSSHHAFCRHTAH